MNTQLVASHRPDVLGVIVGTQKPAKSTKQK
jgi:hypothetical protein